MKPVKVKFSDFWTKDLDQIWLYDILNRHFNIELSDDPEILIYSVYSENHLDYKCRKVLYTAENIIPDYRFCDYSIGFNYDEGNKYHLRYPQYLFYGNIFNLIKKEPFRAEELRHKINFCSFIVSNGKAKERIDFFNQLNISKHVDSVGKVLNNMPGNWQLPEGEKIDFLKSYKFNIAFENSIGQGYTTEKIVEPMQSLSIPIYWGNPLVHLDFNTNSFINVSEYKDFNKVIQYILELENNEELYLKKLNEPFLINNTVPEHLKEDRLIEFFEKIFYHYQVKPVSQTSAFIFNKRTVKTKTVIRKIKHRLRKIKEQLQAHPSN